MLLTRDQSGKISEKTERRSASFDLYATRVIHCFTNLVLRNRYDHRRTKYVRLVFEPDSMHLARYFGHTNQIRCRHKKLRFSGI